ncbi:hypothetical protein GCM10023089_37360 [Quisquiliibacterium transsilvanicum]
MKAADVGKRLGKDLGLARDGGLLFAHEVFPGRSAKIRGILRQPRQPACLDATQQAAMTAPLPPPGPEAPC